MVIEKAATCFADQAWHGIAAVVENVQLARNTWRIRIECPELARRVLPGQFVMVRLAESNDPLLGRPLALYDTYSSVDGQPQGIDLVYLVIGRMTRRLQSLGAGAQVEIWGPLGNGFAPRATDHLVMVAGGIGQTPFPALAQEYLGHRQYGAPPRTVPQAKKVTLCYGVRSAEYLAGLDDFRRRGVDVRVATDDGSAGHHGFVTDVLRSLLDEIGPVAAPADNAEQRVPVRIVSCGPEPMMHAVTQVAIERNVPCEVSLETPMACGIGICFSCVAKVRQDDGSWDYRRTCVEGPVFDGASIVWD
jgi:dihydroorotate dehydrogenase electron transfer subunit